MCQRKDVEVDGVFVPCGCLGFCVSCAREIKEKHSSCPFCEVDGKRKVVIKGVIQVKFPPK